MDAVTRLLSDLVAIPSVNPMGRVMSGPGVLEAGMTEYLAGYFQSLGVEYARVPIAPGRSNIMAWYHSNSSDFTVLFDAHQDTVPVDGMIIEPFEPKVEGGKLFGRGSCDIKGGMAAMLLAFARLVKQRPSGSASVVMACTVDEEFTHIGSSKLAETPEIADLAIVAEPTKLDIVDRHKGSIRWKIRANGTACHSSTPQLGDNAIYRMGRILGVLAEHACHLAGSTPDPVLGPPSLSVGRIEGGQSVNVVPDWCEVEIDRRVIPGEQSSDARNWVESDLRQKLGSNDFKSLEFLSPWVDMPPLSGEGRLTSTIIDALKSSIDVATGHQATVIGVPYGTDGGPLSAVGLPTIVFGPGDIAQAHTKDEWVELDQVRLAVEAYYQMVCTLGSLPARTKTPRRT